MNVLSKRKLFQITLISASLLVSANAIADYGVCNYGNEEYNSITCAGIATLNGTTVKGSLHVMGPLFAKNSKINILNVQGVANLENTVISSDADISGTLISEKSTLSGNISINSNEIRLNTSTVIGTISMKSKWRTPYIYLKSGSQINSVMFTSHSGVVKVDRLSKVKGNVINGRIEMSK